MSEVFGHNNWDAIKSAEYALEHLYKSLELLRKAKNWGLVDIFGGGLFVTMIKRDKMEQAQAELYQAKKYINQLLGSFDGYLKADNIEIDSESFLGISDYLFDNIFTDMLVQQKIGTAITNVSNTIQKIETIKNRLYELS